MRIVLPAALLALALITGCEPEVAVQTNVCVDPGDEYSTGLQRHSDDGVFAFALTNDPDAQPDKGVNNWTVAITESGVPVEGASVMVVPFMTAHDHGTTPAEFQGNEISPGVYEMETFNLFMSGTWDITIHMTTVDDISVDVLYAFCVEG